MPIPRRCSGYGFHSRSDEPVLDREQLSRHFKRQGHRSCRPLLVRVGFIAFQARMDSADAMFERSERSNAGFHQRPKR